MTSVSLPEPPVTSGRIFGAEFIGTFILMLGGPGTAVFMPAGDAKVLAVSLGFGFSLMIAAYAVGPVSGCHINPAVTLAMAIMRRIPTAKVGLYWAAQISGALFGGLVIWLLARGQSERDFPLTGETFATNGWGTENGFYSFGSMIIAEVILTAVLVFVVLSTTDKKFPPAASGLAVGATLTLIHLISIPIDNTSVNPARSLGMAFWTFGQPLADVWAFIVFPMIGAVLGVMAWLVVDDETIDDTLFDDTIIDDMVDAAEEALD